MATLYIAEINLLGIDGHGAGVMAPKMPPIVEQTVAITAGSLQSAPFTGRVAQVHCDAVCSIAFGPSPFATTSNQRLAANETRFISVNPGDKVAVIANV